MHFANTSASAFREPFVRATRCMFLYCRQCGARLEPLAGTVGHTCDFEELLEFQLQCARIELEHGLEAQVDTWAREPRVARRLAFARYMRNRSERGERRRPSARP